MADFTIPELRELLDFATAYGQFDETTPDGARTDPPDLSDPMTPERRNAIRAYKALIERMETDLLPAELRVLSADERLIMNALSGDYAYDFKTIAQLTGLDGAMVGHACRMLRCRGYVEFYRGLLSEDESRACGSGYVLTPVGHKLRRQWDLNGQARARAEVYGTSTCTYCDQAKALLTAHGIPFVYRDIDQDEGAFDDLRRRIGTWTTVPQVFLDGRLAYSRGSKEYRITDSGREALAARQNRAGETT